MLNGDLNQSEFITGNVTTIGKVSYMLSNPKKDLLKDVLTSLEKLKEAGGFFYSAIELTKLSGTEYEEEIDGLISRIKQVLEN